MGWRNPWTVVVVILAASLGTLTSSPHSPLQSKTDEEVQKLFTSLGPKSTTLYFCNSWKSGLNFRLPKPIDCPMPPLEEVSTVVEITFYWEDIMVEPTTAYECYAIKSTNAREWFFFGAHTDITTNEKVYVSPLTCKEMVNNQKTPSGTHMDRKMEGFHATNFVPEANWKWPTAQGHEVINYYFAKISITAGSQSDNIRTTTTLLDECRYSAGLCPTELGTLIWETNQLRKCRLKQGDTTRCLKTGPRISCPQNSMSISGVTIMKICDMNLGVSDQGVIIASQFPNEVLPGMEISRIVNLALHGRRPRRRAPSPMEAPSNVSMTVQFFPKGTSPYKSRYDNGTLQGNVGFMPANEINARFEFMYQLIREKMNFGIHLLHSEICQTNKRQLEMLLSLAESGNPSILLRTLLHTRNYKGIIQGDIISLVKCESITQYMMLPRTECIVEFPIRFISNAADQKNGFLVPLSHEIVETSSPCPCPAPDFYFELDDRVVHLTNRSIVTTMPILPRPGDGINISSLPPLTFDAPGIYSQREISAIDSVHALLRDMRNRYKIDDILRDQTSGKRLSTSQFEVVDNLRNLIVSPFEDFGRKLLILCIIFLAILATLFLFKSKLLFGANWFIRNLIPHLRRFWINPAKPNREDPEKALGYYQNQEDLQIAATSSGSEKNTFPNSHPKELNIPLRACPKDKIAGSKSKSRPSPKQIYPTLNPVEEEDAESQEPEIQISKISRTKRSSRQ